MNGLIYRIRNVINGKLYIGQTSQTLKAREQQHRWHLTRGFHHNPKLQAAWLKYGASAFVFEQISVCLISALGPEEILALAKVPQSLRYNLGPAGNSPTLGVAKKESSKLKQSRSKGGRAFFATNIQTEKTTRFEHGGHALKFFQRKNLSVIYACLHGKRKSWNGYVFRYDPTSVSEKKPYTPLRRGSKRNRAVLGTHVKNGDVLRFEYISESKKHGFVPGNISRCLAGRTATHHDRVWTYADGQPHKRMTDEDRLSRTKPQKRSRPVIGTHPTKPTLHFNTMAEAARRVGVPAAMIHHSITRKVKAPVGGYFWDYGVQKEKAPLGASSQNE